MHYPHPDLIVRLERIRRSLNGSKADRIRARPKQYLLLAFHKWQRAVGFDSTTPYAVNTFWGGRMYLLLPAATDIFLFGAKTHDSEIRLARLMLNHLSPGDQLVDIGAHYGYFSRLAALLVGAQGRVVAVEPAQNTYRVLQLNAQEHPQIETVNMAVAAHNGSLSFTEFANTAYSEYNTAAPEQFANVDWLAVAQPTITARQAITLDTLILAHNLRPRMIKIDVEGAEDQVVSGGATVLVQHKPWVIMEFWANARHNRAHCRAANQLIQLGYQPHTITESGDPLIINSFKQWQPDIGIESDNLVFIKP